MPKLSKTDRITLALEKFPKEQHRFIRQIHDLDPHRTASEKERRFICQHKLKHNKATQDDLVLWARIYLNLKVNQSTISRLLKTKNEYATGVSFNDANYRRKGAIKFPAIEQKTADWFYKHQHNINMSGELIRKKAELIRDNLHISEDDFKASVGWLEGFKKRHGIKDRRRHGESGEVDMALVESERPNIKEILDLFEWSNIYNMDETGLFYQQEGNRSLTSEVAEGRKQSKSRITIAFCSNGDGSDKVPPLIIGHHSKPRCFKGFNMESKKYTYRTNKKAWMTTELFAEWLKAFDNRMRDKGKQALLLLDNFSGHKASKMKDLPKLSYTQILYLPANTTSKLQPMDAGIIRNFKLYYHKRFNRYILRRLEALETLRTRTEVDAAIGLSRQASLENPLQPASIHVRGAIDLTVAAWEDVTPMTLRNCYLHCDIKTRPGGATDDNEDTEPSSDTDFALDPVAAQDIEDTHSVLFSKRPELFANRIDVQSLLNDSEEAIIGFEEDDTLTEQQLLFEEDDDDDDEPAPEDTSEELPKVPRQDAMAALLTLGVYLQQQEGEDMSREQAMVIRLLDHIESKRILKLQQTSLRTYFH